MDELIAWVDFIKKYRNLGLIFQGFLFPQLKFTFGQTGGLIGEV